MQFEQVEGYLEGVVLDRLCEEINVEPHPRLLQVLHRKPELVRNNEHEHEFIGFCKLLEPVDEFEDVGVREDNWRTYVGGVFSFVSDHLLNEICKLDGAHLVLVHLLFLYVDKLVVAVFLHQQPHLVLQEQLDSLIIVSFKQDQQILTRQEKIRVSAHGHLQLLVIRPLGNDPAVVHEAAPKGQVRVHNY